MLNITILSLSLSSCYLLSPIFVGNRNYIAQSNFHFYFPTIFYNFDNLYLERSTFRHGIGSIIITEKFSKMLVKTDEDLKELNFTNDNYNKIEKDASKGVVIVRDCSFIGISGQDPESIIKITSSATVYMTGLLFSKCNVKKYLFQMTSRATTFTHICCSELRCDQYTDGAFIYTDPATDSFFKFIYSSIFGDNNNMNGERAIMNFRSSASYKLQCLNISNFDIKTYNTPENNYIIYFDQPKCFSMLMSTFQNLKARGVLYVYDNTALNDRKSIFIGQSNFLMNRFVKGCLCFKFSGKKVCAVSDCIFTSPESSNGNFIASLEDGVNDQRMYVTNCVFGDAGNLNKNWIIYDGSTMNSNPEINVLAHYVVNGYCDGVANVSAYGCKNDTCPDYGCHPDAFKFPEGALSYTEKYYTDINPPTPSPTAGFSLSAYFTYSSYFTKTSSFSESSRFSFSKSFSKSSGFTKTEDFSKTGYFTKSTFFTKSSDFTKSKDFSKSDFFSKSVDFTKSKSFTNTLAFSKSSVFSKTGQFSESNIFADSELFSKSVAFSDSSKFSQTKYFSYSQYFTKTDYFSETEEFSKSYLFTKSYTFSDSNFFNASHTFTPSNQFSKSCAFNESDIFTDSSFFSQSNDFSYSSFFSETTFFSVSEKFTESISFTNSFEFTFSKHFSESKEFSSSKKFTPSIDFNASHTFSPSNVFTSSLLFSSSYYFTYSSYFLKTKEFSYSMEFSNSLDFTSSEKFTKSSAFTPSSDFTKSNNFGATSSFTSSNTFTASNEFTNSDVFTQSLNFDDTNKFTQSNKFTDSNCFQNTNSFTQSKTLKNFVQIIIKDNKSKNKSAIIGGAVAASVFAVGMGIAIIAFIILRRKRFEQNSDMFEELNPIDDPSSTIVINNVLHGFAMEDDPFEDDFH